MKARKGTVILDKYICKRKLGRGAFGDVYLVEEEDPQKPASKREFALKIIDKKKMTGENDHLVEYLESEVDVMREMDCKHLVKLYGFMEDENNYFMLMEYCDGGDLINIQVKQPDGVFTLEDTIECLKEVIIGLEQLHKAGYLHRDIKMQNILVKTEGGKKVYKVADFGFAKKNSLRDTVLGTEQFMSPEVYQAGIDNVSLEQQQDNYYSYEVDMWSFGIVMFYMLNRSFPFQINPFWQVEEKARSLMEQAKDFSYKSRVMRTTKQKLVNCTPDMENLFSKIFQIDTKKRITFGEIRLHRVFRQLFPEPSQESINYYRLKFQSSFMKRKKGHQIDEAKDRLKKKAEQMASNQVVPSSIVCVPDDEGDFGEQKQIIDLEFEEIDFLKTVMLDVEVVQEDVGAVPCLMLAFSLLKYHIMLLQRFLSNLDSKNYETKYKLKKDLKWFHFFNSPEFNKKKKEYAGKLAHAEDRYQQLYKRCSFRLGQISEINPDFKAFLSSQVHDGMEDEEFFKSYRSSTNYFYTTLKGYLKTHKVLKFYFYLTQTIICHVFDDFLQQPKTKDSMFKEYLKTETNPQPLFSYQRFYQWLSIRSKEELLTLAMKIINECMGA